jgi:hypothetical protein
MLNDLNLNAGTDTGVSHNESMMFFYYLLH